MGVSIGWAALQRQFVQSSRPLASAPTGLLFQVKWNKAKKEKKKREELMKAEKKELGELEELLEIGQGEKKQTRQQEKADSVFLLLLVSERFPWWTSANTLRTEPRRKKRTAC